MSFLHVDNGDRATYLEQVARAVWIYVPEMQDIMSRPHLLPAPKPQRAAAQRRASAAGPAELRLKGPELREPVAEPAPRQRRASHSEGQPTAPQKRQAPPRVPAHALYPFTAPDTSTAKSQLLTPMIVAAAAKSPRPASPTQQLQQLGPKRQRLPSQGAERASGSQRSEDSAEGPEPKKMAIEQPPSPTAAHSLGVPSPETAARNRGQRRVSFADHMITSPVKPVAAQRRSPSTAPRTTAAPPTSRGAATASRADGRQPAPSDTMFHADDEETVTTIVEYDDKRY